MPARGTQLGLAHTTKPTFFFGGFDGRATVCAICVGTVEYLAALAWAAAVESDDAVEAVAAAGVADPPDFALDVLALLAQAPASKAATPTTAIKAVLRDLIVRLPLPRFVHSSARFLTF
jgi:hypothetical protein